MGDINITCAISRKNLIVGEKVKLFFLTNSSDIKFDPNMIHFGFRSPFLYIDAIYTNNGTYELSDNNDNVDAFKKLTDVLIDRGFFKNQEEEIYNGTTFKFELRNGEKLTINTIVKILHRKTINILLDYKSRKKNLEKINSTILDMKLALNSKDVCNISLMVVKESVFNIISFMNEKQIKPVQYSEMMKEYRNSKTFIEYSDAYFLDNWDDSYTPFINVKEKINEILSKIFVEEKLNNKYREEKYIQNWSFEDDMFVENKLDLFLYDPERYVLHNKFLYNLEKLDIVLIPSIYSFSSYNE